ncbi:MAG TPA: OmpA family protein, partial [Pseudolabrys sp.]|nr:OmpA family protein [Pseudolabrys sp.]
PAAQTQPPAGAARPVTPPPAVQTPARPPAAQTAPQVAPPAAPAAAAPPAGVAPNLQRAPLQRSGVPAPTAEQARPIAPAAPGAGLAPQSAQGQPLRRIDDLRRERRQTTEGNRTIIREPDRTIIREGGQTVIRHNEVNRFRYGARDVRLERRGNDNATIVMRSDGSRIVTVLDSNGFLLRRSRIMRDGREIIIIDNRPRGAGFRRGGGYGGFFVNLAPPIIRIPRERYIVEDEWASREIIYETLLAPPVERIERAYSLDEVLYSAPLRDRMPRIDLNTVTFDTGSWELTPGQIEKLAAIADGLNRAIERNPREVFLIEGHTDAVGPDDDNLSLSDRRAESVAIALTQQFDVPPENLTTQGYGEQYLKVPTDGPERANRRVTVRRITPLLTGQAQ